MATAPRAVQKKYDDLKKAQALETQSVVTAEIESPKGEDLPIVEPIVETVEPTAVVQEVVPPEPVIVAPVETYEAQYRSAQGIAEKAGKDLSVAQQENAKLRENSERLLESLDILLAQKAAEVKPAPTPGVVPIPMPVVTDFTEDDKEVIGDLEPSLRRLVRSEISVVMPSILDVLRNEVVPVRNQVNEFVKTAAEQKKDKFYATLSSEISNYFEIHKNPNFAAWVKTKSLGKHRYEDIYNDAVEKDFDAKTVIDIMNEFITATQEKPVDKVIPPVAPVTSVTPAAPVVTTIPEALEEQIAPARGGGGEVPGSKPNVEPISLEEVVEIGNKSARNPQDRELRAKYYEKRQQYDKYQESLKKAAAKRK